MTYQYTFVGFNVGYGAAGMVILCALVFVVAFVKFRIADRLVHYTD
jgi:ABC-type sugar transport system permease subunit